MGTTNPPQRFPTPCEGDDGRPVASLLGPLTSPVRQREVSTKPTVLGAACFGRKGHPISLLGLGM